MSFSLAREFGGKFFLRFDDTNPEREYGEFVESIKEDIRWLGLQWDALYFASDYFGQLYDYALDLIDKNLAFVDDSPPGEITRQRGGLVEGGENSPYRERTIEENRRLFLAMRDGHFGEGSRCLRAKIDMTAPNVNMRDPVLYRIRHQSHHRTGDKWCLYPTYDFTHPLSDSIEGITHSLCTLEFENHRPLYDWLCRSLGIHHPRQIEFARLNLDYTLMSKRHIQSTIDRGLVAGWDDPRLPTLKGLRRRGYGPRGIRDFCFAVGVTKKETVISLPTLEHHIRRDLDVHCERRFVVLRPLKVVIVNWVGSERRTIEVPNHPKDSFPGQRPLAMGPEIYIERDDFQVDPPKKYFRLKPGGSVRLKYAYILEYVGHEESEDGHITEIQCRYLADSLGGITPRGVKRPKGIISWVDSSTALPLEARLYEHLFEAGDDTSNINPRSLEICQALGEESLAQARPGDQFQFERQGYFCVDEDSRPEKMIVNRTVSLKDTWAKG